MDASITEPRRRAGCHDLVGGPPVELAAGLARVRRAVVIGFQVLVIGLLAWRGFPAERLALHAALCIVYLAACRLPAGAVREHDKVRALTTGLLAYTGWIANTGGLASPLIPIGVGMLSPAALVLRTPRQRHLFFGAAAVMLLGLFALSAAGWGALLPPLVAPGGQPSLDYLVIAAGAILVTGVLVVNFWSHMTADYNRVAGELGTRREELCSESEDRTHELEEAAARLAHELKNPLASIKCLSAHMARGALDARTPERLAVVAAEADRLESIIDGFVSLSHGLSDLSLGPVRPHEIARQLVLLLNMRAEDAGVALEVVGAAEAEVAADAKKIRRVLFYLVVNAIQASTPGQTVTIEVSAPNHDVCSIKIIDRGEGMSPEVLERLARPYFSTRAGGSGLGVTVARALVEQHGGQVSYDSAPGRGTTVTISLPRRPPEGMCGKLLPEALKAHALAAAMAKAKG